VGIGNGTDDVSRMDGRAGVDGRGADVQRINEQKVMDGGGFGTQDGHKLVNGTGSGAL
jgi:hypothetical protein